VNGKFAITVTNFSTKASQNTKQHAGAFGVFGTSQGAYLPSGSFKVSIPKTGFEFVWANEFPAAGGGRLTLDIPGARTDYTRVKISEKDLSIDQAQGLTEQTVNWTAEEEVPL
jgi:hypothetical protein